MPQAEGALAGYRSASLPPPQVARAINQPSQSRNLLTIKPLPCQSPVQYCSVLFDSVQFSRVSCRFRDVLDNVSRASCPRVGGVSRASCPRVPRTSRPRVVLHDATKDVVAACGRTACALPLPAMNNFLRAKRGSEMEVSLQADGQRRDEFYLKIRLVYRDVHDSCAQSVPLTQKGKVRGHVISRPPSTWVHVVAPLTLRKPRHQQGSGLRVLTSSPACRRDARTTRRQPSVYAPSLRQVPREPLPGQVGYYFQFAGLFE